MDMVLEAIRKVGQNDFLKGGGENGWKATFDWLMQDEKFTNVLGGVYDRKPQTSSSGSGRKEMVPEWMKNDRANNRAKEDLERTKKVLAEMERENRRLEGEQKPTTGTDPDLAARAEKLRKSLGTGKDGEPNANRQEN